jgi:hypothetical protein
MAMSPAALMTYRIDIKDVRCEVDAPIVGPQFMLNRPRRPHQKAL